MSKKSKSVVPKQSNKKVAIEPVNSALEIALATIKEQAQRHGFGGCENAIAEKNYRLVYICMREIGRDDLAEGLRQALHGIEDVQNG
jgi:hypothetical protein